MVLELCLGWLNGGVLYDFVKENYIVLRIVLVGKS